MEPTKREIKKCGQTKWEVDYRFDGAGTRKRNFYKTEAKADAAIEAGKKNEKTQGNFLARLNEVERRTLVVVLTEIKVAGLTLADVRSAYKTQKEIIPMAYLTRRLCRRS